MLVGAFHVNISDAIFGAIFPVAKDKGMSRPAVEPHVQHVEHLVIRLWVIVGPEEPCLGPLGIPNIRAFSFKRLADARVDDRIAQQEIGIGRQRAFLGEAGQRYTPGALAAEHPVWPRLHHRIQTVAARFRRPFHIVDLGQRPFSDRGAVLVLPVVYGPVDGGKPLRRVAVDHRRLGAPRMRVGVFDLAAGQ